MHLAENLNNQTNEICKINLTCYYHTWKTSGQIYYEKILINRNSGSFILPLKLSIYMQPLSMFDLKDTYIKEIAMKCFQM